MNKHSRRRFICATNSAALLAAAGSLPVTWGRPVVNAVVLPAHADTSQASLACDVVGLWTIKDTRAGENDPGATLQLKADNTGTYDSSDTVNWRLTGNTIVLTFIFNQSIAELSGTMSADCQSFSGSWGNALNNASGTWEAVRSSPGNARQTRQQAKRKRTAFR